MQVTLFAKQKTIYTSMRIKLNNSEIEVPNPASLDRILNQYRLPDDKI